MAQRKYLVDVDIDGKLKADSIVKTGGLATEFLKADGTVDSSDYLLNTTDTLTGTLTVVGKTHANGQIVNSSAHLQVNGFQRTGTIYLHEGGNTPAGDAITISNNANGVDISGGITTTGVIEQISNSPLRITSVTNGSNTGIEFNSQQSAQLQKGFLNFNHGDNFSYGFGSVFTISSTEDMILLVDGKIMYDGGIYTKPSSGTGIGTRKDENWDTAYTHSQSAHAPSNATPDQDLSGYLLNTTDTFTGDLTVTGKGVFAGAIKITETATAQHILIGNQNSGGVNKPAMIQGVNGELNFGYGNSWNGEGGTMTDTLTLSSSGDALFSGDVSLEDENKLIFASQLTKSSYIKGNWTDNNQSGLSFHTFIGGVDTETLKLDPLGDATFGGAIGASNLSGTNTGDEDMTIVYRERSSARNTTAVGAGWITVATTNNARRQAEIIVSDAESGDHAFIRIHWMRSYQDSNFTVLNVGGHANRITGVRVLELDSNHVYGQKVLQVYCTASSIYEVKVIALGNQYGWAYPVAVVPVVENFKSGFALKGNMLENLDGASLAAEQGIITGGNITAANISGVNTGDQDLSAYLLSTTDTLTGLLTVTDKIWSKGAINLDSAAALQVKGFQRTGNIYLHEGGNSPNNNGELILSNSGGNFNVNKTITATNLSGTNTGDQDLSAYLARTGGTVTGDIVMDFTGSNYSDAITFRGANGSGGEVGIRARGESFQIFEPEEADKVWLEISDDPVGNKNALKVNSATGLQTIYHAGNFTAGNGMQITAGEVRVNGGVIPGSANLNSYDETGYYTQTSNANAALGTNYPTDGAGVLTVVKANDNSNHITQTYDKYNSSAFYNRSYYLGTWSSWRNLSQDTVQSLSGVLLNTTDTLNGKLTISHSDPRLTLSCINTGTADETTVGAIDFYTNDSSSEGDAVNAKIEGFADDIYGRLGLRFFTGGGGSPTEKMRIAHGGDVTFTNDVSANAVSIGTGGSFFSDTPGRIATTADFYVQPSSNNTYLYSTNTYLGNASGDKIRCRANTIYGDNWSIDVTGQIFGANLSGTNTGDNASNSRYEGLTGNVNTHLTSTRSSTQVVINSSDGTNATILGASTTLAGVVTNTTQSFAGTKTFTGRIKATGGLETYGADARTKLNVWSGSTYGIGMGNSYTHGDLNGFAMTFQMNSSINRGWWWGTSSMGNSSATMSLSTNGNLSVSRATKIGYGQSDATFSISYPLDVNGTIRAIGDVLAYSDVRVKKNIKTIDSALEKVKALRGVYYERKDTGDKSIGVIAQEIEKILPEVVSTDDEGMKAVAYGNIVGVLIEAVKEQDQQLKEQAIQFKAMQKQINDITNKLSN